MDELQTRSERRRLQAGLLSLMGLLAAAMVVAPSLVSDGDYLGDPLFWVLAAGLVALTGVFVVSRMGYDRLAPHLLVASVFAMIWHFAFAAHGSGYLIGNFAYATAVTLLAAFFLRPTWVLVYAVGNIIGVVVVQEVFGLTRSDQITSFLYIILFSGLLFAVASQKDAESRRREEAVRKLERLRSEGALRDYQAAVLNRAAHRLQTPMMPLVLRLDTLGAYASHQDTWDDASREALSEAKRSLSRLQGAVEDFLEAARIMQAPSLQDRRPRRVRSLLEDAAERFEDQRPDRVRIEVEADDDLKADLDDKLFRRLLTALLENAADACQRRSVIQLRATKVEDGVEVCVEDEGAGLDDEALEALRRFLTSTDETSDAAGLGLLLVRSIAGLHGGTVQCESAGPDLGATFSVWFPSGRD